jgi:hypothetical protein
LIIGSEIALVTVLFLYLFFKKKEIKKRTTMKRLIQTMAIVAFLAVAMTSCEDAGLGVIEVRFENISSYDLENVQVHGEDIGTLTTGERTDYEVYEYISMHNDRPTTSISAMIQEIKLHNNNYQMMFCGVGDYDDLEGMQLESGKYTITIDVQEAKAEQSISGALYIDIIED